MGLNIAVALDDDDDDDAALEWGSYGGCQRETRYQMT